MPYAFCDDAFAKTSPFLTLVDEKAKMWFFNLQ